jgi:hypothetical protein
MKSCPEALRGIISCPSAQTDPVKGTFWCCTSPSNLSSAVSTLITGITFNFHEPVGRSTNFACDADARRAEVASTDLQGVGRATCLENPSLTRLYRRCRLDFCNRALQLGRVAAADQDPRTVSRLDSDPHSNDVRLVQLYGARSRRYAGGS